MAAVDRRVKKLRPRAITMNCIAVECGGRVRGRRTEDVKLDDKSNLFAVCGDSELGLI